MFIKLKGTEVSIASANDVGTSSTIRIINTGAAAVANVAYANGTLYASLTVANTESVVISKGPTDTVIGANMKAVPVEYRG